MTVEKLCLKEVDVGLKMVQPQLTKANLSNYKKNIANVAKFLVKVKKDRKKWFVTMSVDYFNCLLDYYKTILKLDGFRVSHIDSALAKDLYLKFLEDRGSLYWNGSITESSIVTSSGTVHQNIEAENINVEKMKERLKTKFEKTVKRESGMGG